MQQISIARWPGGIRTPMDITVSVTDVAQLHAMVAALREQSALWPVRMVCSPATLVACEDALSECPDMAVASDTAPAVNQPWTPVGSNLALLGAVLRKSIWQASLRRTEDIAFLSSIVAAFPGSALRSMLPDQIDAYRKIRNACRIWQDTAREFRILNDTLNQSPPDPTPPRLTLLLQPADDVDELVYPDGTRMPLAMYPRDIRGRYIMDVPVQEGTYLLQPYAPDAP